MPKIFQKYLIKQYLFNLFMVTAVITGLLLLFDFIELTRVTSSKNILFYQVAIMTFQKNPIHVQKVFGFLILLASILTYRKLAKNSELIIFKSAGLSVYQILYSLVIVGFIIGIIYSTAINPLISSLSASYHKNESFYLKGNTNLLSLSKTGLWIKQVDPQSGTKSIIHALKLGTDHKQLQEVTFYNIDEHKGFTDRITAKIAEFENGFWNLTDVKKISEKNLNEKYDKMKITTNITLKQIQESLVLPESLSFWKLPSFIIIAENSGLSVAKHKIYYYRLLVNPIFFASMIILGAAFSMNTQRFNRENIMLSIVLMIGFIIYFFSDLIFAFAVSGGIPIWLGACAPSILTLMIGIITIFYLEEIHT